MDTSLYRSFSQALPTFPADREGLRSVTASGETTRLTRPPVVCFGIARDFWINVANQVLRDIRSSNIRNERLAQPESVTYHRTEADVVRSSSIYLLHPVHQALSYFNDTLNTIKCLSECTRAHTRSDAVYFKSPAIPGNNNVARSFAVLEYKRRGKIQVEGFQTAARNPNDNLTDLVSLVQRAGRATAFSGGAEILMQQASAYAVAHRTQYVALFDWDSLVLIVFPQLSKLRVGDYCRITYIDHDHSYLMRKALLGFLLHAWQSTPY